MTYFRTLAWLCALAAVAPAFGQQDRELNLFERTEAQQEQERQSANRQPERREPRNSDPAFTLRGTSRFGDKYFTSLETRGGDSVQVQWRPGQAARIPGYTDYQILDIQSREVSIQLPSDEICVESKELGVSCSGIGNVALLSLSVGEPIAPDPEPASGGNNRDDAAGGNNDGEGDSSGGEEAQGPINPFTGEPQQVPEISDEERERRAERARARRERLRDFEPVRIPDDQVPEGMRKVSTPFGDRLVPVDDN